ncbi:unnamed protein product [Didymodactylos carnosus]|uniref:RNA helicase n=1 Tax=Didymodactylos carnosus TaxID=1234261 RepID=A0A8S2T891_9BILA|nr:unnamed protein product [Didymodactylos carnosus]CAF4276226.1 unnamed protein product [Didymodactylos carnosus]
MFSATITPWVKQASRKYMSTDTKFEMIDLIKDAREKTATSVQHLAIPIPSYSRANVIDSLMKMYSGNDGRAICFCETKRECDELSVSHEIRTESHVLHGDIPQDKRELVLQRFREGKYRLLITTDVAARGLDVPEVDLVIVTSPPKVSET